MSRYKRARKAYIEVSVDTLQREINIHRSKCRYITERDKHT